MQHSYSNSGPRPPADMTVSMTRINRLVLDYLVVNGMRSVAENFVDEAGLPSVDLEDIECRGVIAEEILEGRVEAAIGHISDHDTYFLDTYTQVYFLLLELQMIELAREALVGIDADPSTALPLLEFTEKRMVPFANQHPKQLREQYLTRVEAVLALVCFPLPEPAPAILGQPHRRHVASTVNSALLTSRGQESTSRLTRAIKTHVYTESKVT